MLKQLIIGGLAGGITLFIWGFVSWAVMTWHFDTVKQHDGITAVVENIEDHLPETGVYSFPPLTGDYRDEAVMKEWEELHNSGPSGMIFYNAEPRPPMSPMQLLLGFVSHVAASMFATILLLVAIPVLPNYASRVVFVTSLGLFSVVSIHFVDGVFHYMPISWTMGLAFDAAIAWTLVGLVLGAVIRRRSVHAVSE